MSKKLYKVGVVGATGAVGKEMVQVLFDRKFPTDPANLFLFASERSAGSKQDTPFGTMEVVLFSFEAASKMDYLFLAVSGSFAEKYAPELSTCKDGPVVIDNSSAFRYKKEIPLVVPEINAHAMAGGHRLVANPNCTTAIAAMALWPLYKAVGLKKVIVSTYQASSGAGAEGMQELQDGLKAWASGKKVVNQVFAHPLPFNVIPQIDVFQSNGYTKEEMKVVWETQKIFEDESIQASCTAVRIPTLRAHSEAITIETRLPIDPDTARYILEGAPGVDLVDSPSEKEYPMPLNATGRYNVQCGRIRQSLVYGRYGLDFFVSGDQLLRGAALNAVLIAEAHMNKGTSRQTVKFRETLKNQLLLQIAVFVSLVAAAAALVLRKWGEQLLNSPDK